MARITRTPFAEGEKVALAVLTPDDADACFAWYCDPAVRRFLSSQHIPNSAERSRRFIEEMNLSGSDALFGIVVRKTREYIGNIALHGIDLVNRNAFLGIAIGSDGRRGKGYGTEANRLLLEYAFGTLGLNTVYLNVYADNARAIASYEKIGFERRGAIPECFFRDGSFVDCVVMSVLKRDFYEKIDRNRRDKK